MSDIDIETEPGEIYKDLEGNLWEVMWTCKSPTVGVRRVYRSSEVEGEYPLTEKSGGINGYMWAGFEKITGGK